MKMAWITAFLVICLCGLLSSDAMEETCEIEHCEEECQEGQGILMEKTYEMLMEVCDKSNSLMEIMQCNLGKSSQFAASSCKDIAEVNPESPSGDYWVTNSNGTATKVYCSMNSHFGTNLEVDKGFMRVAYINELQLDSEGCPEEFVPYKEASKTLCGMGADETTCKSIVFSTCGVEYQTVCGRVQGYSWGAPNAFGYTSTTDIDGVYVDGISITYGSSPRKHVWTYASGQFEKIVDSVAPGLCPCTGVGNAPPDFVENDYYCESGQLEPPLVKVLHIEDPLWDGLGCNGDEGACCENTNQPWFCKQLPEPTTDDLELRVCATEESANEDDVPFELIELYVQ